MLTKAWPMDAQFTKDRGNDDPFNRPHAMFLGVGLSGAIYEIEADLDMFDPNPEGLLIGPTMQDCMDGRPIFQTTDIKAQTLLGINFLCPRCMSPLYVPTPNHPKPRTTTREIIVHWDKPIRSNNDGKLRPTFTIVGEPLKCDYLNSEITGISGPGIVRCGWVGIIENGKAYEHSTIKNERVLK